MVFQVGVDWRLLECDVNKLHAHFEDVEHKFSSELAMNHMYTFGFDFAYTTSWDGI